MRSILKPYASQLMDSVSRRSQPLSWLLYIVGIAISLIMWNPPFASPVRLDVNDLSPGTAAARIRLSEHGLADELPLEKIIYSQRTDGAQKLLLCVLKRGPGGMLNSLSVNIGRAMFGMDPAYLSKDLIIKFPENKTEARQLIHEYLKKHSQSTIAALILEEAYLPAGCDVELDVLGPKMIRPNLDLVASTLRNCRYLGLRCRLKPDKERIPAKRPPLHWTLNKHRVDALTVRLPRKRGQLAERITNKQRLLCALIESELRSLNNLNDPLHDSSFMYLISPYDDYNEPLVLYPPHMTVIMAPFPLSMIIGSLKEQILASTLFYNVLTLSVCSHCLLNLLWSPLIQVTITCLLLDLTILGRWPTTMKCQVCQHAALFLIVLAVIDFLEALTMSMWLVPFVLLLFVHNVWAKAVSILLPLWALWFHTPYSRMVTPLVSLALAWLIRN